MPLSETVEGALTDACRRYDMDERLVRASIHVESGGREDAVSPVGATGLMQVMQGAVDDVQNIYSELPGSRYVASSLSPEYNVRVGVAYMARLRTQLNNHFGGGVSGHEVPNSFIVAAYNCGFGRFTRAAGQIENGNLTTMTFNDIRAHLPTETQNHVDRINSAYTAAGGASTTGVGVETHEATVMVNESPNVIAPSATSHSPTIVGPSTQSGSVVAPPVPSVVTQESRRSSQPPARAGSVGGGALLPPQGFPGSVGPAEEMGIPSRTSGPRPIPAIPYEVEPTRATPDLARPRSETPDASVTIPNAIIVPPSAPLPGGVTLGEMGVPSPVRGAGQGQGRVLMSDSRSAGMRSAPSVSVLGGDGYIDPQQALDALDGGGSPRQPGRGQFKLQAGKLLAVEEDEDVEKAQALVYEDTTLPDFFKVGDVVLKIPPQSIRVDEANTSYSFQTLRTKGNPKLKTGEGRISITADCMFPSIEEINGYTEGAVWYGGLRGMIAQYYRAPFLPLENALIRRLIMPDTETMTADEWDEHESLRTTLRSELSTLETMLGTYDPNENTVTQNFITNQIVLTKDAIKDADDLERKKTWDVKASDDSPDFTDTPANIYNDQQLAVVLDSFSISTVPGFPDSLRATFNFVPFNYVPFSSEFTFVKGERDASVQAVSYNGMADGTVHKAVDVQSTHNISESTVYRKYYLSLFRDLQDSGVGVYPVVDDASLLTPMTGNPDEEIVFTYSYTLQTRLSLLRDELAAAKLELELTKEYMSNENTKRPPGWALQRVARAICAYYAYTVGTVKELKQILKEKLGMEDAESIIWDITNHRWTKVGEFLENILGDKAAEFVEHMDDVITKNLETMGIKDFATGRVVLNGTNSAVTGITATYQNKVTPIKLVGQDYPTFQYMGGSDVEFTITLQTADEDLLADMRLLSMRTNYTQILQTLVDESKRFVDTAADVEGELFELLGVGKVLVTDVTYSTVDGHPGMYDVQLKCVQADVDLDEYEALVGTKVVDARILKVVLSLLHTPPSSKPWPAGSVWEEYSNILRDNVKEIETRSAKRGESRKKLAKDRPTTYNRNIFSLLWRMILHGKTIPNKTDAGLSMRVYEVGQKVKVGLENRQVAELIKITDDPRTRTLHELLERNRKQLDEGGNPCYGDMNLPTLTANPLDTPADFYFKRDGVVTNESIVHELAVVDQYKLVKLEQAFRMNFENAEKEWSGIENDLDELMGKLRNAYNDPTVISGSGAEATRKFLQKYARHGINATKPMHVVEVAKHAFAAAKIKRLEIRINELKNTRVTFITALENSATGTNDRYVEKMTKRYDDELERLEEMRASLASPNGIVHNTAAAMQMADATWGYTTIAGAVESANIRALAMNAAKSDQSLHMARAFPAIKLYFIEEDAEQWLLFDDFYAYNAIKSVSVIKSVKSASDTAVITLSNITNTLTDPLADYDKEKLINADTREEQIVDRLMLRPGCPIMIRMGYHNDPMRLDMVFLGGIATLNPGEGSIEIVAQSWGAQFNEPVAAKGEKIGAWDQRKAHGDIVSWALNKVPGLDHFGRRSMLNTSTSSVGGRTNDRVRHSPGDVIFASLANLIINMSDNRPADDNVYLPYNVSWDPLTRPTFDWRIDPGQTVWEVINEILLWYPDWIVTTLPYVPEPGRITDQRLTLYVGPQDGFYKWTDKYDESWLAYQEAVRGGGLNRVPGFIYPAGESAWKKAHRARAGKEGKTAYLIRRYAEIMNKNLRSVGGYERQKASAELFKKDLRGRDVETFREFLDWLAYEDVTEYRTDMTYLGVMDRLISVEDMAATFHKTGKLIGDCEDHAHFVASMADVYGRTCFVCYLRAAANQGHAFAIVHDPTAISDARTGTLVAGLDKEDVFDLARSEGYALTQAYFPVDCGKVYTNQACSTIKDAVFAHTPDVPSIIAYVHTIRGEQVGYYSARPTGKDMDFTGDAPPGLSIKYTGGKRASEIYAESPTITEPSKRSMFFDTNNELLQCFKPVIAHHFYDSDHHIVNNSIVASVYEMSNKVLLSYPKSEPIFGWQTDKFDRVYEMVADDDIKPDHVRAYVSYQKNIDTNWFANCFKPMLFGRRTNTAIDPKNDSRGGVWNSIVGGIKATHSYTMGVLQRALAPDTVGDPLNAIPQYIRVANVVLNNQVREMYAGELTVVGDPSVKPWDKVYMYDFANSMVGPFQVEQVIHHFSNETGFTTKIKPNVITHCQNFQATLDTGFMNHIFAWGLVHSLPGVGKGLLRQYGVHYGARAGSYAWGRFATGAMKAGAAKLAAKVGGKALGYFVPGVNAILIAWTAADAVRGMGLTFEKEIGKLMGRQPIVITPLCFAGKPLVAGLEGMRTDDIWVHLVDSVSSLSDLPYMMVSQIFKPR